MSGGQVSANPTTTVKMDVWNEHIFEEKEQIVTIKNLSFKIRQYTTVSKKKGMRVPLIGNNSLCDKFREFCDSLKKNSKYTEREKKYNLIRFTTFWENDKTELKVFGSIGFYYLDDYMIFADEPNDLPPSKRFALWVEYYTKVFNIETKADTSLFDLLDKLDMSEA